MALDSNNNYLSLEDAYIYNENYENWKDEWDATIQNIKELNNKIHDSRKQHILSIENEYKNKSERIDIIDDKLGDTKKFEDGLMTQFKDTAPDFVENTKSLNKEYLDNMKMQLDVNRKEVSLNTVANTIEQNDITPNQIRNKNICNNHGSFNIDKNTCKCDTFWDPKFFCGQCKQTYAGSNCDKCDTGYIMNDNKDFCSLITCQPRNTFNYNIENPSGNIDKNTGKCNTICKIGWATENCDRCDIGWYSSDCSKQVELLNVAENKRTYSSTYKNSKPGKKYARSMIDSFESWKPKKSRNQSIVLDLDEKREIFGVRIQGRTRVREYVRKFKVEISDEKPNRKNNFSKSIKVDNDKQYGTFNFSSSDIRNDKYIDVYFDKPVCARYLKLIPTSFYKKVALRVAPLISENKCI